MDDSAILEGGPMDGHRTTVADNKSELVVTMLDGCRHRYVKVTPGSEAASGSGASSVAVFRWHGRI